MLVSPKLGNSIFRTFSGGGGVSRTEPTIETNHVARDPGMFNS